MHKIGIIALVLVAALGALPARVQASQFTVVAQVSPASVPNGGTATLTVHTRIGADCTATVDYQNGSQVVLTPAHQHVGKTGIIHWLWTVKTTASAAQVFVSCQWKGQGRGDFATVKIQGRQTLSPTARPKPVRPGVAALGDTKAQWSQMFGADIQATGGDRQDWLPCFVSGATARLSAVFREGHAYRIEGAYCTDQLPSEAIRLQEAEQYFPADTVFQGKVNKSDGSGIDYEYIAPSLAHEFVPGDFLDCGINTVKPGTFSVSLAIDSAQGWVIQTGSCV